MNVLHDIFAFLAIKLLLNSQTDHYVTLMNDQIINMIISYLYVYQICTYLVLCKIYQK